VPEPSDYADFGILHRQFTSRDIKIEPALLVAELCVPLRMLYDIPAVIHLLHQMRQHEKE